MKNVLITICARGGSKGIPGKNIRPLAGKELIAYSINHANEFKKHLVSALNFSVDIEISTDDIEIKKIAKKYDLTNNYTRPDALANDTAGKLGVIKDILLFSEKENNSKYDYILDLDVSAPMRTIDDLKAGYNLFVNSENTTNLFSVSTANKNPYFNMVEENKEGFYNLSKSIGTVLSRQTAPKVYEMNASFYFYKRNFFNEDKLNLFKRALIFNMNHESFDLDHIIDFEFLEFLINNNKLTFNI
jgi:CMP-N,N'-diacetyllegionaminic acid synthase